MQRASSNTKAVGGWPHRTALLLVCLTFPLIWVGGLVTTYDAGMAVPDWPNTYGYNLFLYPLSTWWAGPWDLFIEHGHRLLAALVGLVTIGWVYLVWRFDPRPWMLRFSLLCLGLVLLQGMLGGARVLLDASLLARLHGCLGPLFFGSCVAGAVFTSKWWHSGEVDLPPMPDRAKLSRSVRMAWAVFGLAYLQLVLGAHLRHLTPTWPPLVFRLIVFAHLAGALALLLQAAGLKSNLARLGAIGVASRIATLVTALVAVQIVAGSLAWRVKYQWPAWVPQPDWLRTHTVAAEGMPQVLTVTSHVAIGSLILATSLLLALRLTRAASLAGTACRRPHTTHSVSREVMA